VLKSNYFADIEFLHHWITRQGMQVGQKKIKLGVRKSSIQLIKQMRVKVNKSCT
jgi:hypothetical protein